MTTEIKESTKEYLKLFNACPIKIGDTVRVIRGWKNGDYGYFCPFNIENGNELLKLRYIVKFKRSDYYYLESGCNSLSVPFFALELVEKAKTNNLATSDDYLAFHNASGLKVGDTVKVVRIAKDYEMGWGNIWAGYMDDFVDRTYKITGDATWYGWELNNKCTFPTFVLQKVDYRVVRGGKSTRKNNKKTVVDNLVPLVPAHNPNNLTPKQYGAVEGYRLLYADEIKDRQKEHEEIEAWANWGKYWDKSYFGHSCRMTYRTKLSREELAKLQ